jgi:pSer/pThr/pTyr-binding forkhead associated (FHA) protein
MRLEILIDKNAPVIYPLNGPKVVLGSSEKSDIVIPVLGVSRKHVCILIEGDQHSVVDLGSTNGSFINENRLIPGKKTEFTTFFPLRLGTNVLVTLVAEEDYEIKMNLQAPLRTGKSDDSSKTRIISLKELNKTKTEKLINIRDEKRAESLGNGQKKVLKKKKFNFVPLVILSFLLVVAVFNFSQVKKEESGDYEEVGKIIRSFDDHSSVKVPETSKNLIPENELPSRDYFTKLQFEMKCISDVEKVFCSYLPGINSPNLGVTQVGLSLYALVDGTNFINASRDFFSKINKDTATFQVTDELIADTAVYMYLMSALKKDLDVTPYNDMNLFVGLFEKIDNKDHLFRTFALKPKVMNDLRPNLVERNLVFLKSNGESALSLTKNYYRTF